MHDVIYYLLNPFFFPSEFTLQLLLFHIIPLLCIECKLVRVPMKSRKYFPWRQFFCFYYDSISGYYLGI